ncbi:MAG: trimethylamine methyltransferase family protein, partial [Pseudomonadota bacterium]
AGTSKVSSLTGKAIDLSGWKFPILPRADWNQIFKDAWRMERDYFYPLLADRDNPKTWADNGAPDAWTRAKQRAHEILAEHQPEYLTPDQDRAIRERFDILI